MIPYGAKIHFAHLQAMHSPQALWCQTDTHVVSHKQQALLKFCTSLLSICVSQLETHKHVVPWSLRQTAVPDGCFLWLLPSQLMYIHQTHQTELSTAFMHLWLMIRSGCSCFGARYPDLDRNHTADSFIACQTHLASQLHMLSHIS